MAAGGEVSLRDNEPLARSSKWRPFHREFSSGAQDAVLLLSLKPLPAGKILRGDFCLDDLSITKK